MGEGGERFGSENRLTQKAKGKDNLGNAVYFIPHPSSLIPQAAAGFACAAASLGMKTISTLAKRMVPARK